MKHNPWCDLTPNDYVAHMAHPNVGQMQLLNRIIKEQFELLPASARSKTPTAILGITNGNGLEHVIPCGTGHIVGIDINKNFLEQCKTRYPELASKMSLYQLDLVTNPAEAIKILAPCGLIIANLLIEHIQLANFTNIISKLPKRKQIITCVIQVNPDGEIASSSGSEHVFDAVIQNVEAVSEDQITLLMNKIGCNLLNRAEYDLPNGKQFIRLDYSIV